jgi:serine/threonine protein phosphatase PrpC
VVVLIIGQKIICANLGDARAVMCRNGKALDLSVDFKASRKDE